MTTPWNLTASVTQRASHRNQPTDLFTPNLLLALPGPNCPFVLIPVYVRDAGKEADGSTARPALVPIPILVPAPVQAQKPQVSATQGQVEPMRLDGWRLSLEER